MTTIIRQIPIHQDWNKLITMYSEPGRRQRGIRYAEEGRVQSVQIMQHEAQATVQGTEPEPYWVSVSLSNGLTASDDIGLDVGCTCQDPEWVCKHVVALMTVLGQKAAQQHPDDHDDHEHEPKLDDYTAPPERLEPALPQGEADFWAPGPAAGKQYTPAGIHLLDQLGDLPRWRGKLRFGPLMRSIYRDASQAALILLEDPTQPPAQKTEKKQTTDHTDSTPQTRPNQQSSQNPRCQCPCCVYERNARNKHWTHANEPARNDTMIPGMYEDYMLKNNYEWSPCGRRLQPSNSISFAPEYEDEDEDEYEDDE